MPVKVIAQDSDFKELLDSNKDVLILVDFHALWCGPCKMIGPKIDALSEQDEFKNVIFAKVDVDDCQDTAEECGISAMPTIHFYRNGGKVGEVVGANMEKIEAALKDLM